MKKLLLSCILGLFLLIPARATHIIGGELYYDCLGGDNYLITLKIYRDCLLGEAPYDNPANISIWTGAGSLHKNISLSFPGATKVPFVATNPCFQAPPNVCVEEAIYTAVVNLPPSPTGYILAYQRCCRNNSIVNLTNPQNTGATYIETIPPAGPNVCNNSPRFNSFPPIAICIGDTLRFDHSATDPDGDSLVYEFCTSFAGANPSTPQPVPTSAPPFPAVQFAPPYSQNYPIATNPAVSLNSQTGLLVVSPSVQGQFVVGVCAKEYRNGVLIGTHRRDFQFNVTTCLSNSQAIFQLPPEFIPNGTATLFRCGDNEVDFTNFSVNASDFLWDFGDPTTLSDTSDWQDPSYTYPDTGYYVATLIANPGYFCADTLSLPLLLLPQLDVYFDSLPAQCIDGNSFAFLAQGSFGNGAQFNWDFPSGNPGTSTAVQPNVSYPAAGTYPVTLYAQDLDCRDTAFGSVLVLDHPVPDIDFPEAGCAPFTLVGLNNTDPKGNTLQYYWDFGNGETSTLPNPVTTYPNPGTYSLYVQIVSTTGCQDIFTYNLPNHLTVFPSPTANYIANPTTVSIFTPYVEFTDLSSGNITCWLYFDNGDSTSDCTTGYTYSDTGHYQTYQVVTNTFGCPDTHSVLVWVKPEFTFFVPNTFTVTGDNLNETFRGLGIGVETLDFRIYDRWGHVIFRTENQTDSWNGKHMNTGPDVPEDIYVWAADILDVLGETHRLRGKVLLLRTFNPN